MVRVQSKDKSKKQKDLLHQLLFQEIFHSSKDSIIALDEDQKIVLSTKKQKFSLDIKRKK